MNEIILLTIAVLALAIWGAILEVRLKDAENDIQALVKITQHEYELIDNVNERTNLNRKAIERWNKYHSASVYGKAVEENDNSNA